MPDEAVIDSALSIQAASKSEARKNAVEQTDASSFDLAKAKSTSEVAS